MLFGSLIFHEYASKPKKGGAFLVLSFIAFLIEFKTVINNKIKMEDA